MANSFKEAVKNRRSLYGISDRSPVSDEQIKEMIEFTLTYVPSAFNSQSTRIVVLLHDHHKKLWEITKGILRKIVPGEAYNATEEKIDRSFASGYGTLLFYEDWSIIENLQRAYPAYKDNFPRWAEQASAMHQFVAWTLLEEAGLGASLQHYNPLIDEALVEGWGIDRNWKLIAQMPFGTPIQPAGPKEVDALDKRVLVFE